MHIYVVNFVGSFSTAVVFFFLHLQPFVGLEILFVLMVVLFWFFSSKAFIWKSIREPFKIGNMHNTIYDLLVLPNFGVVSSPSEAPMYSLDHVAGWIKFNTNGSIVWDPSHVGYSGVFKTTRGFIKGNFYSSLPISSSCEAELWGVIMTFKFAKQFS